MWLVQYGFTLKDVEIPKDMSGLRAKTDIYVGTCVCQIPKECLITIELAKESDIGKEILTKKVPISSAHENHIFIACFILQELKRGKQSEWHHYIETLPKEFREIPLFWNKRFLNDNLKGSIAFDSIERRIEELTASYLVLCQFIEGFANKYTLREFMWARCVVVTRIFGLHISWFKTSALVPFADLVDHGERNLR